MPSTWPPGRSLAILGCRVPGPVAEDLKTELSFCLEAGVLGPQQECSWVCFGPLNWTAGGSHSALPPGAGAQAGVVCLSCQALSLIADHNPASELPVASPA
jgi:hypothetical protein